MHIYSTTNEKRKFTTNAVQIAEANLFVGPNDVINTIKRYRNVENAETGENEIWGLNRQLENIKEEKVKNTLS